MCWAYAISTMLRASIRSALKKYNIEKGLEILDNPNHHKMMRKELVMNIFPFGNDGTDPSIVIKLVCYRRERSSSPEQGFARIQGFASALFLIVENEGFARQGFARKEEFARSLGIRQLFAYSITLNWQGFARFLFFWRIPNLANGRPQQFASYFSQSN